MLHPVNSAVERTLLVVAHQCQLSPCRRDVLRSVIQDAFIPDPDSIHFKHPFFDEGTQRNLDRLVFLVRTVLCPLGNRDSSCLGCRFADSRSMYMSIAILSARMCLCDDEHKNSMYSRKNEVYFHIKEQ